MYLQIPRIKVPIPLFVIFRALNIISDKEICELIVLNIENANMKKMLEALRASIIDANKYMTQECAIKHIVNNVIYTPMNMDKETGTKKKYNFAIEVLNNDIFPHCKTEKQKIYMLGYMTNILL
jgi:DNA-directed RNA polymerase II subunit RPB2